MEKRTRSIAVIDMKTFYAFVECVDRGLDPWKTPLIVADKSRGTNTIVLSVSPYLKSHGVPSRLRVKELPKNFTYIYATPRMERYIEKSAEIVSIFLDFVSEEDIHVYSIDEAFIELTSYLSYYQKTAYEMVETIIETIKNKTGLTATAGIGDNFFLAKVALDIYAKKEQKGIAVMHKEDVETKLWPITPLSKIWGIGPRTEAKLQSFGIFSIGDLAHSNLTFLTHHFGVMGEQLFNHAHGIDEADMHEVYIPKSTSLSIGQVLFKDYDKTSIKTIIREMCDDLGERLRQEKKKSSLVSLYIGYSKNQGGFSRQMSLLHATDETNVLFEAVMEIFQKYIEDIPIRNVGINFGKLTKAGYQQLNMFLKPTDQIKNSALLKAIDQIHERYGKNILLRASALTKDSTTRERHEQIGGHKK